MTIQAPSDTQVRINDLPYKIGAHGFTYVYTVDEWKRSTKTHGEIKAAIRQQERANDAIHHIHQR